MKAPLLKTRAEWTAIAKRLIRGHASKAHVEGAAVGVEIAAKHIYLWLGSDDAPRVSKKAQRAIRKELLDQRRRWAADPEDVA